MQFRLSIAMAIAILALLALPVAPSWGQSPDALKKAQAAFDQAQVDYLQGKYDEAATGFQAAYDARQFPQFLYNIGAAHHMKGKKTGDVGAYTQAVDYYRRYLTADPKASDKPKAEKAMGVLETEIKRIKDSGATPANAGSGSAAPPVTPSTDVQNLGDVKVRGLVVIESEPHNATIY